MTAHESLMTAVRDVLENYYVLEFDQNNKTESVVWVEREKMQALHRAYLSIETAPPVFTLIHTTDPFQRSRR